ncbi:MAG: polysaccharide deacetylase family protein [Phycisphaerales bacterium]
MAQPHTLIINFHRIGNPAESHDAGEAGVTVTVAEMHEILDLVGGRSDVRITSDDGFRSDIEELAPALASRGLQGEFFILAGRLGEPGSLDDNDVRALHDMGMRIGTHGWDHIAWRSLDTAAAQHEMVDSCRRIESCGVPGIQSAACPFGTYGRKTIAQLRVAGIHTIYTSDGGWGSATATIIPRNSVGSGRTAEWVSQLLRSPGVSLAQRFKRSIKRWR